MNKIIKISILYCLPILTIQSCKKKGDSKSGSDPKTNSTSQTMSQTTSQTASQTTSHNTSQTTSHTTSQTTSQTASQTTSHTTSQTTSQTASQTTSQTISQTTSQTISQNTSQSLQPINGITEAVCENTKNYILAYNNPLITTFFEQTVQEIINGNTTAVNKKNARDHNVTLLDYAMRSADEEFFKELLKLSPDLTQKDASQNTILLEAIRTRRVNFVNILLAHSNLATFINEPDCFRLTPLRFAENEKKFINQYYPLDSNASNDLEAIIQALEAKAAS